MTGTIIPAAKTAAKWISEHRTLILALTAGIASATVAFKAMKTAATAIKAVKELKTVWEAASKGGATLANASKLLTVKFLVIAAAIAAAVAIGVLIYKNWDKIKAKAPWNWARRLPRYGETSRPAFPRPWRTWFLRSSLISPAVRLFERVVGKRFGGSGERQGHFYRISLTLRRTYLQGNRSAAWDNIVAIFGKRVWHDREPGRKPP